MILNFFYSMPHVKIIFSKLLKHCVFQCFLNLLLGANGGQWSQRGPKSNFRFESRLWLESRAFSVRSSRCGSHLVHICWPRVPHARATATLKSKNGAKLKPQPLWNGRTAPNSSHSTAVMTLIPMVRPESPPIVLSSDCHDTAGFSISTSTHTHKQHKKDAERVENMRGLRVCYTVWVSSVDETYTDVRTIFCDL